mmetsp:Transcript_3627/g.9157  ORF Transcript_3627/g.9157 Transcript_3627/m.9157 type:complete len:185 (+) Transcript_3627:101-655(+)
MSMAAAKYMFCPAERGLRTLQRGYRTPDPSPSPSIEGLVGKLELRLVEVDEAENEEDEVPTPRHQAGGASAQTNVQTDVSRTPSPSPKLTAEADWKDHKPSADESGEGLDSAAPPLPPAEGELCVVCDELEDPPSIGSIGHPHTCKDACKYVRKRRGCKDGANCERCHLCSWNQSSARRGHRRG